MEKVSVTIIVLNEEKNIRDCLESVSWADEVLVSDSGSVDGTAEICKAHGAKVFTDDWKGFGAQKNLLADRAANNWVFNIDADERVTQGLKSEIMEALKGDRSGWYVPRKNFFGDRWIRYCGWYPDYNLRLYRKDKGRFAEREVHEAVKVDGTTGYMKNPLDHYTYKDVSDYLARMQRYSTLAAEEMHRRGKKAGAIDIVFRPVFTFIKMFVLKRGFLEGSRGLTLSMLYASYTLAKYAKLIEKRNAGR